MYYNMFKLLQVPNRDFYNCYIHLNVFMYIILIIKVLKIIFLSLDDILVNFIIKYVSVFLTVLNNFTILKLFHFLKLILIYARKPLITHH